MSRPVREPVGGVIDSAAPTRQRQGSPQALVARGRLSQAQALASAEGQEGAKDRVLAFVDLGADGMSKPSSPKQRQWACL